MDTTILLFASVILVAVGVMREAEGVMCRQQERDALLDLKKAAQELSPVYGGQTIIETSVGLWFKWDEREEECCAWQGVTCDEASGRVYELHLPLRCEDYEAPLPLQCRFSCSPLPSSLSRLEALEVLDLRGACFSDATLINFSTLTNLSYLDLSSNSFPSLPDLPLLPRLTYLNLSKSCSSDGAYLSKLVTSVPNLQYLDLSANCLKGVIPEQIGTLQNLVYLGLVENFFDNPVPWQSLANLSRLSYLSLGCFPEDGPVLVWEASEGASQRPCNWKALESLSCLGMRFTSNISIPFCLDNPRVVSGLKDLSFQSHVESIGPLLRSLSLASASLSLKTLSLQGTSLSEFEAHNPKPAWLHALDTPFLEELDLSYTGLSAGIRLWLPHLPYLHRLNMAGNRLSKFPPNLVNHSLESLDLSSNAITSAIPLSLLKPSLLHLDLSDNSLSGVPPLSLGNLSSLSHVDLSGNNLTGVIPLSLGRLSNLHHLALSGNNFTGNIPLSIGNLSNLHYLDLSSNSLTGKLSKLFPVDLVNSKLSGTMPVSLGNLSVLTTLLLSDNHITGTIPNSLGNLSVLTTLRLSHNHITGSIPNSIFQNSLSSLDLSGNQLVGSIPHNIQSCASLRVVDLSNNFLSGSSLVLDPFQNCEHLRSVDFSNNNLTGDLSHTFHNCKELQEFRISNNLHIWGEIPREIGNCSNLGGLDLSRNHLSGKIPRELFNSGNFFSLDLSDNNLIGALPPEIGNCSDLGVLHIAQNSLSSEIPVSLGKLTYAYVFEFRSNKLTGGIPAALQNCSHLRLLDLNDNQLSGTLPEWIRGRNLPNLRVLLLSNNQFRGSLLALEPIIQNLTGLQILGLASNYLSGSIPRNVNRLRAMTYEDVMTGRGWGFADKIDYAITAKGNDQFFDDISGYVTALDFSHNLLEGEIPPEIGALTGLYSLNLSHNALNGSIPSSLRALAGVLESLDLSNNKLTGAIPPELCFFDSLGHLNLSHNRLKGTITPSSSCTHLCTFDASCYASNDDLLYECFTPPKSHDTPVQAAPPPDQYPWVAKLQEHISLQGWGLGHILGFLLVGLFLHRRALFN